MGNDLVIGVLGGMGTYATIHVFQQFAEIFPAKKEWERPRIIIDNRCTMPSRVLAYLEGRDKDILIKNMRESLIYLIEAGANAIVLACNTSHLFLPDIYQISPEIEHYVKNIIHCCVNEILNSRVKEVGLLGTEGTIQSKVYQKLLEQHGVKCVVPEVDEYAKIRKCIEAVKQSLYDDEVLGIFASLVNRNDYCILGCTELPILYNKISKGGVLIAIYMIQCI